MKPKPVGNDETACANHLYGQYSLLHKLWDDWIEESTRDTESEDRYPPALTAFINDLITEIRENAQKEHGDNPAGVTAFMQGLVKLHVWMFEFGQRCMQHDPPIRVQDLDFCKCGTLTDHDIEMLLKGE